MNDEVPVWEKMNLTIKEAAAYSGIGMNKLREIAGRPDCTFTLRNGRTTLIKRKKLEQYLETIEVFS